LSEGNDDWTFARGHVAATDKRKHAWPCYLEIFQREMHHDPENCIFNACAVTGPSNWLRGLAIGGRLGAGALLESLIRRTTHHRNLRQQRFSTLLQIVMAMVML
jgi:hypothetical protein